MTTETDQNLEASIATFNATKDTAKSLEEKASLDAADRAAMQYPLNTAWKAVIDEYQQTEPLLTVKLHELTKSAACIGSKQLISDTAEKHFSEIERLRLEGQTKNRANPCAMAAYGFKLIAAVENALSDFPAILKETTALAKAAAVYAKETA